MDALLLTLLILLNGVFAMAELALVSAREARLAPLAQRGDRRARAALVLKASPTRFLSTVQIGITSIGLLNGIVGEAALAGPLAGLLEGAGVPAAAAGPTATVLVVGLVTYATIVVGELLPKRIAQSAPERVSRLVAVPMRVLARLAAPFVWMLTTSTNGLMRVLRVPEAGEDAITDDEVFALLREGMRSGQIEANELEMVRKVFRLDDRRIGSFMTPRTDMITLDVRRPLAENLRRAVDGHRTRYPLVDGETGEMLGLVHARDLLAASVGDGGATWPPALAAPLYVPETLSGRELLERLHDSRVGAALVVDEYGDLQGMVTMSDLLNAVGGDPERRRERPGPQRVGDDVWSIDGMTPALDLLHLLEMDALPGPDTLPYDTVGGMMQQLLGHLPAEGDSALWQGWRFEVRHANRLRVRRVEARRVTPRQADGPTRDGDDA